MYIENFACCKFAWSFKTLTFQTTKIQSEGSSIPTRVEPPNRGHFGTAAFVLSLEVVLFSEVV